jgi:hypothetical protein
MSGLSRFVGCNLLMLASMRAGFVDRIAAVAIRRPVVLEAVDRIVVARVGFANPIRRPALLDGAHSVVGRRGRVVLA